MPDKAYILFFNAANQWNGRREYWHPDVPDPPVDEWVVGELEDSYVTDTLIDAGVVVRSHHKVFRDAVDALAAFIEESYDKTT